MSDAEKKDVSVAEEGAPDMDAVEAALDEGLIDITSDDAMEEPSVDE